MNRRLGKSDDRKTGSTPGDLLIALRHPLRRRILLEMPDDSGISPQEIAHSLRQSLGNVSYHIHVLLDCGAIALTKRCRLGVPSGISTDLRLTQSGLVMRSGEALKSRAAKCQSGGEEIEYQGIPR